MKRVGMIILLTAAAIGSAARTQPMVITNPDWARLPSANDIAMSQKTIRIGLSGAAKIKCEVTIEGKLDQCSVVEETPPGVGFGAAALEVSKFFLMRPRLVNGAPVGGATVIVPIQFRNDYAEKPAGDFNLWSDPVWAAQATPAQIALAFPKNEVGRVAEARVVLQCKAWVDGTLARCDTIARDNDDSSFDAAARSLVKYYRLDRAAHGKPFINTFVDLTFSFASPDTQPTVKP